MKTRCRNCRVLINFGESYCKKCLDKIKKNKQLYKTERTLKADTLLKGSRWQSLRREIIRRDKGCCALCLIRGIIEYRGLQVHHIIKRTEDTKLAFEKNNLITVCRSCHEEVEKLSSEEQKNLFNMENKEEEIHFLL